ncbi:type VI secretion system-associated FHA domain protein [Sphingobium phenoxybenzoativorans]|uniref:type VI secretion system-associated FHA domain protein n=1 Tax=Sphingobium phenoxybenzoativorans TaxID=1592790 RepID=UPI0008729CBC|nr:type VI secretion system-associated FHA domain protein [Sphingobium phenoxybenzoativorans]
MYVFKLFEGDEIVHPVDARFLADGVLRIGRDPAADWVVADVSREISRWHCEFEARDGRLSLRCLGANGVYGADGKRMVQDQDIEIIVPTSVRFGPYVLSTDYAPQEDFGAQSEGSTLILAPPMGRSISVPTEWQDSENTGSDPGESLLDAFCEGAGLHASAFVSDKPAEVMRQAGALYRQMLLGVADLMSEREQLRQRYALAHTTIGGSNNNPFKWAPSQRLAVDLLRPPRNGFMAGQEAMLSSFRDIKKHVIATFSGFHRALEFSVSTFAPAALDAAVQGKSTFLKPRAALIGEEAAHRHTVLANELAGAMEGELGAAFLAGYHAAEANLESPSA